MVYRLSHLRTGPEYDDGDAFHLGIYSTHEKAEAAAAFLRSKPGFAHFLDDFIISEELLDQIRWEEGFVRVTAEEFTREVDARKRRR